MTVTISGRMRQVTISGVSTQPTEMMAIMQSNHITMSHEFISGKYVPYSGPSAGLWVSGCLLFSFTTGYDEALINKLRGDDSIYDLFVIGGE